MHEESAYISLLWTGKIVQNLLKQSIQLITILKAWFRFLLIAPEIQIALDMYGNVVNSFKVSMLIG